MKIQFTKDHGKHGKGEVLTVDDKSGKSLIDRKVAEEYDGKKAVVAPKRKPGVIHIAQVAEADYPKADEAETDADKAPAASASASSTSAPAKP